MIWLQVSRPLKISATWPAGKASPESHSGSRSQDKSSVPSDRFQRLTHAAADHLVIVNQKGASRGRAANAGQCLDELGAVYRLHKIVGSTKRITTVLLVNDRHQYDRDGCQGRIALDGGKHRFSAG